MGTGPDDDGNDGEPTNRRSTGRGTSSRKQRVLSRRDPYRPTPLRTVGPPVRAVNGWSSATTAPSGAAQAGDDPVDVALEHVAAHEVGARELVPLVGDPRGVQPTLPENTAAAILKALSPAPEDRYATAKDFAAAVL